MKIPNQGRAFFSGGSFWRCHYARAWKGIGGMAEPIETISNFIWRSHKPPLNQVSDRYYQRWQIQKVDYHNPDKGEANQLSNVWRKGDFSW